MHNPLGLADPTLFPQRCLVGGEWIGAADGATIAVHDPATGERIGDVPALSPSEVAAAIDAAARAQPAWAALTAAQRAVPLHRLFDLLNQHRDDLARIMTHEQGKPTAEALAEVTYAATFLQWFAEEGRRLYGDIIPSPSADKRILVFRQPVGVFAAITPWNFPLAMLTRKAAAGWAAGCAGVLRPAPETPLTALAFGVLAERAGLPTGVCNLVTGDAAATGLELCTHPKVRKLSFTGSTRVGALLLGQCAPTIKKTSMELGGNAPFLVFADADLDEAIAGAVASRYRNSGQTCVCANRFIVHADIYDAFCDGLTAKVAAMRCGHGADANSTQGPLISAAAVARVHALVTQAVEDGARVTTGGTPGAGPGSFFLPTVLVDVPPDAAILREEIFGPVATICRFETEEEAIALANDSPFGLAAYVYTRDIGLAFRAIDQVEAGMIGLNDTALSTEVAPFGGVKNSGIGREGSKYGLHDYTELKYAALKV